MSRGESRSRCCEAFIGRDRHSFIGCGAALNLIGTRRDLVWLMRVRISFKPRASRLLMRLKKGGLLYNTLLADGYYIYLGLVYIVIYYSPDLSVQTRSQQTPS